MFYFKLKINLLLLFFALSISDALAQELEQYNMGFFTIALPNNCQLMQEENNVGMACRTYSTLNKKFIYSYYIFTIDEEFDLKERLGEEALGMNIDIDKTGYFAITTGTDMPLLSTMAEFDDFSLTMGIYPCYEKEYAVFICLIDAENKNVGNLVQIMSTFRPLN